nr:MAG TPA: hypothetical protein [Caudoviricetes sp.]
MTGDGGDLTEDTGANKRTPKFKKVLTLLKSK